MFVVALAVAVLGFYLGWFHVSTNQANDQTNISITVDKDKIRQDEQKAKETVQDVGHQVKERIGKVTDKAKEEKPNP